MKNIEEQIDFVVDRDFVNSLCPPGEDEIMKHERFICFYPLYRTYLIYGIIAQFIGKNVSLKGPDIKKLKFSSTAFRLISSFKQEISIYGFIYDIMLNNIDAIKVKLADGTIDINSRLDKASLFQYAIKGPAVWGFCYLSVAAILGRKEIFTYLLKKGANPGEFVFYDTVKPAPVPLSVNECLLMNEIFQWYKSGKKQKIKETEVNTLIDAIILASRITPDIVSDTHLIDDGISVMWYWLRLREMVEDVSLLKRLIPLNPKTINELLNVK